MMSQPVKHVSSDELLAAAQSPIFRLLSGLSTDDPAQISRPEDIERALSWTRSYKPDDPQYAEKLAVETDYRHLGFFDEQGQPIDALVAVGRKFIREHPTDTPSCARLWRHIQAHLGKVQPEDLEADFGPYCAYIATLIDGGIDTVEISEAVLKVEQDGMDVPTVPLCQADRLRLILATFPAARRDEMIETLKARELDWFPPDSVARTMRQIFKDKNYGLGEEEANAWLESMGSPSLARQIKGMFGDRNKAQTLQDLGLLDENWQWSEVGFQREQALLRDVRGKEISPSLEWLRWELHCRHHRKDPFPLSWALMNDFMSEPILYRARRLASVALSGGLLGEKIEIGETITPEQFSMLRKLGAWIHTKPAYHEEQNLWWLGFIAKQDNLSWKNWEQICSFVYGKLDQTPDYELLQDWKDGVVTFEGRGRHQENSEEPFKGKTKVGRNDPCPCNSGKKYKKCCGR